MRDGGMKRVGVAVAGLVGLVGAACSAPAEDPDLEGKITFRPERPELPEAQQPAPYTGSNASVREAQAKLPTGFDLHAKVIYRTCSPNGGVCHNNKEYPDLRTPASFLAAIDAPCNVQPGTPEAVYNRCERPGDRLRLGERDAEVGYIEQIVGEWAGKGTPDATTPGLHVYLGDPLALGQGKTETYGAARFVRSFVNPRGAVEDLVFASFETRWWILDGGKHLFGQVPAYRRMQVQELLTVGIVQGDANRDGIFGARQAAPLPLLRPGKPEESYLIGRVRGTMFGSPVPGTRMPLANQPLSVSEMLALFCFVEGLAEGASNVNLASKIDYNGCRAAKDPESLNLLGSGVTWARRVRHVLEANCGGCHASANAQGELDLKDGNVYERLVRGSSKQKPAMALVKPGKPAESYLWLKLTADPADGSIVGARMPLNPLTGQGKLSDAELADIKAWIEAGAVENE
jgi:hypothetical protein